MNTAANILTFLSLICGFIAILLAIEGHFTFACWVILLSVLFDGLDGQLARMAGKSGSEFGKELDSLVDAISFGIAPSILGYIFVYRQFKLWDYSGVAYLFDL